MELKNLKKHLEESSVCGIWGLPGVGKSTLAKEYAYQYRNEYPDGVLWVVVGQEGSSTDIRLNPAAIYYEVAHILNFRGAEFADLEQVRTSMANMLGNRKCLLILDNVIDSSFVYCLPPSPCHTIITTRSKALIMEADVFPLRLKELTPNESQNLLELQLGKFELNESFIDLLDKYYIHGGLPLYINLLARTIVRGNYSDTRIPEILNLNLNSLFNSLNEQYQRMLLTFGITPLAQASAELISVMSGESYNKTKQYLDELVYFGLVSKMRSNKYNLHIVLKNYLYEVLKKRGMLNKLRNKYSKFYYLWCKANWYKTSEVQEELFNILQAYHYLKAGTEKWQCQIAMYVWALEVSGIDHFNIHKHSRGYGVSISLLQQLYPNSFLKNSNDLTAQIIHSAISKDESVIDDVINATFSTEENIRWAATWALGQYQESTYINNLIKLTSDKSWFVRWAAVEALSNFSGQLVEEHIVSLLVNKRLRIRGAAIDALCVLHASDKLPMIETFLDSDVPVLRGRAVSAILKLGTKSYIRKCAPFLRDPNLWVQNITKSGLEIRGLNVEDFLL
jgi:hypothetical protein